MSDSRGEFFPEESFESGDVSGAASSGTSDSEAASLAHELNTELPRDITGEIASAEELGMPPGMAPADADLTGSDLGGEMDEVESERFLLLDIQRQHAAELAGRGITAKAATRLKGDPPQENTRTYVSSRGVGYADSGRAEIGLAFTTPRVDTQGMNPLHQFVPVAETFGGVALPLLGFSQAEADTVYGMGRGLQDAKEFGVLPNLNGNLSDITTPPSKAIESFYPLSDD